MIIHRVAILLCAVVLLSPYVTGGDGNEEEPLQQLMLRVGAQDDMKTRNILGPSDIWTSNLLSPVYGSVGLEDPATQGPLPYLLKGVDADDDGVFDLDEYGTFQKEVLPFDVTAYYDFNGVLSHDGVQMTMDDLLFSYHLRALDPREMSLDVIKDKNNLPGTNYSTSRWLHVWPVLDNWDAGIPVGPDATLTFALRFSQQATYSGFVRHVLSDATIIPMHIWEGTGKLCLNATGGVCDFWKMGLHSDFGYAYDPVTHNGVPATNPNAFDYFDAESWEPSDDEVVGTGPFEFDTWIPGVSAWTIRYEDYAADALDCERSGTPPVCQGNFYSHMHKPIIEGMLFKIYKTAQASIFALQAGEIDLVSWSVPPEFLPNLQIDPTVGISITAERGFTYLGYNMRMSPFGYLDNDPTKGDDGYYLRKAVSHVIDKQLIISVLLQDYGVAGNQPIRPEDVLWYNGSVTKYNYDLDAARQILDDHYTISFQGGPGLGWTGGYRNLPSIGNSQIEILCPQADYDPIQASACNMIASKAREVGLNMMAQLMAFSEITERLANRDMQMWTYSERINSYPAEFYTDFYYSGGAPAGLNYAGFQNYTFDSLCTDARAELDLNRQQQLIKEASALLADNLPNDVLHFKDNIEAYREDRFVNWTVGRADSIFADSYWSWIGIHPPYGTTVDVLLPGGGTVNEGESLPVEIFVHNGYGDPLGGANVTVYVSPAGPTVVPDSGVTAANGTIGTITFTAPEVTQDTMYWVTAYADYMGEWGNGSASIFVRNVDLLPPEMLDVTAEPDPQEMGGAVNISLSVQDESLVWVICQVLDAGLVEIENATMFYDSLSDRYYLERTYDAAGTYGFRIWAIDLHWNENSTEGSFHILGPPPTISDVQWQRLSGNIPTSVNVSATIEGANGVDGAWLHVWDPDGQEIGNYSMLSSADLYWKVVQAGTAGTFAFRISARDAFDKWAAQDGAFTVADETLPTADAGSDVIVSQGDTVTFDGTGSTDNWRVESYMWTFFNGTDVVTLHGPLSGSMFNVAGGFLVMLEVRDPAGNADQDYLFVQVIATDADGDGLSDWDEENTYGTDPADADTDGDGMGDGAEVAAGRDPLTADEEGKEVKPLAEELWWVFLLFAVVFLAALVLLVLMGWMRRRPEEPAEEDERAPPEESE
ncbi:MAG: ABC transporter substrate-binding protein [Candidatus Thermoplasmatota archaeon]|nr:ABC transporter substrate-binding protein [Candidatus Thermoplasmatota archaeon]